MTNKTILTMESRIHGDMYVRFGGGAVETCCRKVARRYSSSLLKVLCEEAEINTTYSDIYFIGGERHETTYKKWERIGTHTGRKTFVVTSLYLGIDPLVVMKWTGHSDFKAMKPIHCHRR